MTRSGLTLLITGPLVALGVYFAAAATVVSPAPALGDVIVAGTTEVGSSGPDPAASQREPRPGPPVDPALTAALTPVRPTAAPPTAAPPTATPATAAAPAAAPVTAAQVCAAGTGDHDDSDSDFDDDDDFDDECDD